jgi:hypothetical protein
MSRIVDGEDGVGKKAAEKYPQTKMECNSTTGSDSLVEWVEEWMNVLGLECCDCLDGGPESQR